MIQLSEFVPSNHFSAKGSSSTSTQRRLSPTLIHSHTPDYRSSTGNPSRPNYLATNNPLGSLDPGTDDSTTQSCHFKNLFGLSIPNLLPFLNLYPVAHLSLSSQHPNKNRTDLELSPDGWRRRSREWYRSNWRNVRRQFKERNRVGFSFQEWLEQKRNPAA